MKMTSEPPGEPELEKGSGKEIGSKAIATITLLLGRKGFLKAYPSYLSLAV